MALREALSSIYDAAISSRNYLYDVELLDGVRLPVPVLSVGNLSIGGTGKTPVAQWILAKCLEMKLRPGLVSRNYKAQSRSIQRVDLTRENAASYYGDEAFLLAQKFSPLPVWTGPQKFMTAQALVTHQKVDLLIVDDGFQHRALQRDFDLVLLDCTSKAEEDFLLPQGRLRENYSSLRRASAVGLTKSNWATPERIENLRKRIPEGVEVFEIEFHQGFAKPVEKETPSLLVSGIAQPKVLEKNLAGYTVREHLVFADHHAYTEKDVGQILQAFRLREAQQILTTEKDLVKLQAFPDLKELLNPIQISTKFKDEPKGLHGFLGRCFIR